MYKVKKRLIFDVFVAVKVHFGLWHRVV